MDEVYCARCGDLAPDGVDGEDVGPCCRDLPNPWHRGEDGLYNRPSESEAAEEEDYREEEREEELQYCEECEQALDAAEMRDHWHRRFHQERQLRRELETR